MADRAHLTPVTVTDRRGRTTTVYKDLAAHRPATARAAAVPAVPRPAAVSPADEPLPTPPPLPTKTLAMQARLLEGWSYPPMRGLERVLTTERAGRTAMELAQQLHSDGTLTEGEAHRLVILGIDAGGMDNKGAALSRDMLRVAGEIAGRWPDRAPSWATDFVSAMVGARVGRPKRLSTRGQLASLAAVVEFTMRAAVPGGTPLLRTEYRNDVVQRRVFNRDLDALLRERPGDLDRITAYVHERGIPARATDRVTRLREWLDANEDAQPLEEGWL